MQMRRASVQQPPKPHFNSEISLQTIADQIQFSEHTTHSDFEPRNPSVFASHTSKMVQDKRIRFEHQLK